MHLLAIDTATQVCSVAVTENDTLLVEYTQNSKKTHSQRLLPLIDAALSDAGISPAALTAIAVAAGPGSFTGVRIGVSTARAMAQGLKIPALGICTLESLAQNIITAAPALICPILDARRNEVYTAVYRRSSQNQNPAATETILPPSAIPLAELISIITPYQEKAYFPGDGLPKFAPALQEALGAQFAQIPPHQALNRAANTAYLARRQLLTKPGDYSLYELFPYYIRKPEAERSSQKDCP